MIIQYPSHTAPGLQSADVGKGYVVSLPYLQSHPCLAGATLIAHKNLPGHGKGWTVTHLESGCAMCQGATRAQAIEAAGALCEKYDEARLAAVFQRGIDKFNLAKGA